MSAIIDVAAADAWELLADGFGDIGQWTNAVDSSQLVGERVDVGAERHCRISGPFSGDGLAVERLTAFDRDTMTYAYELVRGGPAFITTAGSKFTVTALASDRCRVDAHANVRLRWRLVPLAPLISLAIRSSIRRFVRDLRYRLEHHAPHPDVLAR